MSLFNNKPTPVRLHKKVSWREKYEVDLHGIFLSVIVFHDSTYEKTRSIMNTLQELCGGEIQYHEYWVSKGFIPHSQASLENIDESKVLEIIGELQDDEYYSIDDEYHDLDDGGIING